MLLVATKIIKSSTSIIKHIVFLPTIKSNYMINSENYISRNDYKVIYSKNRNLSLFC